MALDIHDQVTATRTATRKAARRARKQAHETVDAARAAGATVPVQVAKTTTRTAKRAAKLTARATGRRAGRSAGRRLRVVLIAVFAAGLLALVVVAFRRTRGAPSQLPTTAGFDEHDPAEAENAENRVRAGGTNGGPVTTNRAAATPPASGVGVIGTPG
jgi:hypothetical protein